MDALGLGADVVTLSCEISSLTAAREWEAALAVFASFPERAVDPDAVSVGAAIAACEVGRAWTVAFALHAEHA